MTKQINAEYALVRTADMEPIGDPRAAALLQQLAALGITPDQAANELRRIRMDRQEHHNGRGKLDAT